MTLLLVDATVCMHVQTYTVGEKCHGGDVPWERRTMGESLYIMGGAWHAQGEACTNRQLSMSRCRLVTIDRRSLDIKAVFNVVCRVELDGCDCLVRPKCQAQHPTEDFYRTAHGSLHFFTAALQYVHDPPPRASESCD